MPERWQARRSRTRPRHQTLALIRLTRRRASVSTSPAAATPRPPPRLRLHLTRCHQATLAACPGLLHGPRLSRSAASSHLNIAPRGRNPHQSGLGFGGRGRVQFKLKSRNRRGLIPAPPRPEDFPVRIPSFIFLQYCFMFEGTSNLRA
jgi:hypothetical protein